MLIIWFMVGFHPPCAVFLRRPIIGVFGFAGGLLALWLILNAQK